MIYPVIMAGGSGSRLWPLSRDLFPKQFLKLGKEGTMLQETVKRLRGLDVAETLLVCNEEHRFIAAEQLRQLGELNHNIILEPAGRNTAPAIALAAFTALQKDKDAVLLVLAADHVIEDVEAFHSAVRSATPMVSDGSLVTFGIVPGSPETGYGYIRTGDAIGGSAFEVQEFVEKPNLETAKSYVNSGEYLWNSGMFMFKAARYLEELREFRSDIYQACERAMQSVDGDLDFIRVDKASFLECPSESIDYAVMEKTSQAAVVPLSAGWSDVGAWSALWDITEKDSSGNVGVGDVLHHDTSNSYIYAENSLVATVGVENIVVVQTKDAILVANKDRVQDVKEIVNQLKAEGRGEYRLHREVYRPWGHYDSVDCGERYQVKRITVKPGEKLSVQMHHHRAEHWIVVSGTARVTVGDSVKLVTENQSVYIPVGDVHALENPGKIPLELIEVQSGGYLGEDDIVRFEDRYGRN